jgi:hypothetical protein
MTLSRYKNQSILLRIAIGNHRWYIFLDIQLRFSYIQLTQKRVLIIYLTF